MNERQLVNQLLRENQLQAKRSLGQNFLCSEEILEQIAEDLPDGSKRAFELGPGLGSLTAKLLEKFESVTAIELDQRLIPILQTRFEGQENLHLIHGDMLTYPWSKLSLNNSQTILFGNLPYYITQPGLERAFTELPLVSELRFVLQKEAIDRIMAGPGNKSYGPINICFRLTYQRNLVGRISGQEFYPPPRIQSAYLRLINLNSENEGLAQGKLNSILIRREFLAFLKVVFNQRRKQLGKILNRLSQGRGLTELAGKYAQARAEDLQPEILLDLFLELQTLMAG